ncbi:hypothetical protein TTRE_0000625601 [Trichuris trichiura]|uniref:Uncharacterized protein n=1 Tax=Trichuris trichiura TaxID=36087 RepID=A0A077ZC33_TRITR|nr:hypothetical protein TTRE_0000625601 [Trichuris trichiura]
MAKTTAEKLVSGFIAACLCLDTIAILSIAVSLVTPLWQVVTLVDRRQEFSGKEGEKIFPGVSNPVNNEDKLYPAVLHFDPCTTALTSLLLLGAAIIMGVWDIFFSKASIKSPDRIHAAGTLMSTSAAFATFGGLFVFYENALRVIYALWLFKPNIIHESYLGYSFWFAFAGFCFFLASSFLHMLCWLISSCSRNPLNAKTDYEKGDKSEHVKYFVY